MTKTATATVEVLTAEVRVLMVGSRQVTLSVAHQLDTVDLEELEPFGRVRTRDHAYAVIGKDLVTGVLVLATYLPSPPTLHLRGNMLVEPRPVVCPALVARTYPYDAVGLEYDGWPLTMQAGTFQLCGKHSDYERVGCGWDPGASARLIAGLIRRAREDYQPHVLAQEMPLIVLAGLR